MYFSIIAFVLLLASNSPVKSFKNQSKFRNEFQQIGVEETIVKKLANVAVTSIAGDITPGIVKLFKIFSAEFRHWSDGSSIFNIGLLVSVLDSRRLVKIESIPYKVTLEYRHQNTLDDIQLISYSIYCRYYDNLPLLSRCYQQIRVLN